MNAQPLAAWAVGLIAALCALFATPASAQMAQDLFIAQGVEVDVTAANAAAARSQGLAQAERAGFERVVRRITLASERAQRGQPAPSADLIQRMIARVDVVEERRSTTRYIARLNVRTNPAVVREYLRREGFTVVETRAAPVLIVPVAQDASGEAAQAWREAWVNGGYDGEPAPMILAPAGTSARPDWSSVESTARDAASAAALFAALRVSGSTARAELTEVGPSGASRSRGVVQAAIGSQGLAAALASLAAQTNDLVQEEWKQANVLGQSARTRISVSALYGDRRQWTQLKNGLRAAEGRLVSGVSVDALSQQGALVSFSYVGGREQLEAELRRNGLMLLDGPLGAELRLAPR